MANESEILWVDVENNALLAGWEANTTATTPTFKQGDNIKVEIHFVKRVSTQRGIFFEEVPTSGSSFKLAVGNPDTLPTGGFWTLSFGSDKADFLYNATAVTVQNALNAFPSISSLGGVAVEKVNGDTTYRISFNQKVALPSFFSGDPTNLLPSSTVIADEIKVGSTTTKGVWHIKSVQVPIAYQSVWTPQSSATITATAVQLGTTRVKITPAPKDGTFSLGVGTINTAPISVFATAFEVQAAISDVIDADDATFEVKKSGSFIWDVSQTSGNLLLVTANGAGLISFDAVVGELNFNNYETASLLAGATTKNTTLEIEVTTGGTIATVLQTRCTIVANLIGENVYAPMPFEEPVTEAPEDGQLYARKDGGWVSFQEEDNQGITQAAADARYLQQSNNLSDLDDLTVGRTNLGVYSTSEVDTALSAKANLSGAAFTGDITTTGRMGIGGGVANNPLNKLAIYNGNIVFSAGYGLAFGDGTTQTTAASPVDLTGYATESWVSTYYHPLNGYPIDRLLSSSYVDYYSPASVTYPVTYYDGFANDYYTFNITATAPSGTNYGGWSVLFTESYPLGVSNLNTLTNTLEIGVQSVSATLQDACNLLSGSSSGLPTGWTLFFDGGNTPYAMSNALVSSATLVNSITQFSPTSTFVLSGGVLPELTAHAISTSHFNKILASDATGVVRFEAPSVLLGGYALLSGANFTGKVSLPSVSTAFAPLNLGTGAVNPTNPLAGDVWFNGDTLRYRSQSGTSLDMAVRNANNSYTGTQTIDLSSTSTAVRITQRGSGNALVVEDSTFPDTSSFVVNANGIVGVGKDPATWVPPTGVALDVTGRGIFSSTTTHPALSLGVVASTPTTLANGDLWIDNVLRYRVNGATVVTAGLAIAQTFTQPQVIQTATTATLPALRITNQSSNNSVNSFVVEDSTTPDNNSFVIDHNGNVGIGVDPATWTATDKFEVRGNIKFNDGTTQSTAPLPAATIANTRAGVTNLQVLTPQMGHWMMMNPNIIEIQRAGFNVTNTGTIAVTNQGWISSYTQVGTAGACSSRWRTFGLSQVDQVWSMTDKSIPQSNFDFSNRSWCSGRSTLLGVTESVFTWGFYHGKHGNSDGVGDLVRRGYGWKLTGGAGSRFLELQVHDGTTLTSVVSSYAVTNGVAFDWDIISGGNGTVTLYVNGTQVATTNAGPTGSTNLVPVVWSEEVSTSGASVGTFNGMVHSRGKFIAFDP